MWALHVHIGVERCSYVGCVMLCLHATALGFVMLDLNRSGLAMFALSCWVSISIYD